MGCGPAGLTNLHLAEMAADGVEEGGNRDGLGDVGLAAAAADALLVALHGEGGDGDHRDVGELLVVLEPLGDLKAIPVIAVTAFAMKGDEERIREGGCEAYISKPISVAMFLDTVRQYVGDAR